ncbi:hypothetical protein L218DRAFT_1063421 [Marasmius fiardii PR-910]|nr:hypothetical protein L218DRAFT_1063421 [Marasmius fiardii PR-910]
MFSRASTWAKSLCLILHLSRASVKALLENRTIDDEYGDSVTGAKPIYFPTTSWYLQPGKCSTCERRIIPDNPDLPFKSTWHEGIYDYAPQGSSSPIPATVNFSFTGTSLSVFCILPPYTYLEVPGPSEYIYSHGTYLTFTLDGQPVLPAFSQDPEQLTDKIQYNVSVFSQNNLENKNHTFVMEVANPQNKSYVYFDFATYIYESLDPEDNTTGTRAKRKTNVGAIVGGVLGTLVGLVLILGGSGIWDAVWSGMLRDHVRVQAFNSRGFFGRPTRTKVTGKRKLTLDKARSNLSVGSVTVSGWRWVCEVEKETP